MTSPRIDLEEERGQIELRANREHYAHLAFAREHPGWFKFLDCFHAYRTRLPRRV